MIHEMLRSKGLRWTTYQDWLKINAYETKEGEKKHKLREKIKTVDEFYKVLSL
jgi:hypothetical protein